MLTRGKIAILALLINSGLAITYLDTSQMTLALIFSFIGAVIVGFPDFLGSLLMPRTMRNKIGGGFKVSSVDIDKPSPPGCLVVIGWFFLIGGSVYIGVSI